MLPEHSESYEEGIEARPRGSFTVIATAILLAILVVLFARNTNAEFPQDEPQGATERGWVVCWNKANRYTGKGHMVWNYTASECMEIELETETETAADSGLGLGSADYDYFRGP